jgi:hypothetical protein
MAMQAARACALREGGQLVIDFAAGAALDLLAAW